MSESILIWKNEGLISSLTFSFEDTKCYNSTLFASNKVAFGGIRGGNFFPPSYIN